MNLELDRAIEILEITDISNISTTDLPKLKKKAQRRWHPDTIVHAKPSQETINKYKENFQSIDRSIKIVENYLNGELDFGNKINEEQTYSQTEPEEIIRANAKEMQETLRNLWEKVKSTNFKHTVEEYLVADGFKLKDLLMQDLEDDAPTFSIISFIFGSIFLTILSIIGIFFPFFLNIIGIAWIVHALACFLIFLPLSRIWLPEKVSGIAISLVNFGMEYYNEIYQSYSHVWWGQILVSIPALFAKAVKYLILYPLYWIAGEVLKNKRLGQVKENVNYYAGIAEWYAKKLMNEDPQSFTKDQLFHLSYMYGELKEVTRI